MAKKVCYAVVITIVHIALPTFFFSFKLGPKSRSVKTGLHNFQTFYIDLSI